jgi:SAM-dependent methyltransferase
MEGHLDRLGRDGLVLDLGCGRGYWLDRMDERLEAVGVEYRYDRAREYDGPRPLTVGDATRLPLRDGSVALVWCIHVLHHLPDPEMALAEARRVLRPDGHLVLAETVEDHPLIRVGRRIRPFWDGVPVESRYTGAVFRHHLRDAGFDVVDERQHSLVSWAAWALPRGEESAWIGLTRLERRVPRRWNRWGAHLEVVARPA